MRCKTIKHVTFSVKRGGTEDYLFLFSCIYIKQFKKHSKETSSSDYLHSDDSCGENGMNMDRKERKNNKCLQESFWWDEECAHMRGCRAMWE